MRIVHFCKNAHKDKGTKKSRKESNVSTRKTALRKSLIVPPACRHSAKNTFFSKGSDVLFTQMSMRPVLMRGLSTKCRDSRCDGTVFSHPLGVSRHQIYFETVVSAVVFRLSFLFQVVVPRRLATAVAQ